MGRWVGALIGAVMTMTAIVPGLSAAANLIGHRAIYRMSLATAESSSGIVGARGAMLYRFADSCDGWTVEHRTYLRIQYEEGDEVETTWSFAGWEAKDGLTYRFRLQQDRNGVVVEKLQGRASLERRGGAGIARFSIPADTTIELPAGTLFPTEHLLALIEAAGTGDSPLSRRMFDGTSLDNPYEVNAVIGKPVPPGGVDAAVRAGLARRPEWRMRLAFFPLASRNATPDFEIELNYRDDGIADKIIQDFGDFELGLNADAIEILPSPDC